MGTPLGNRLHVGSGYQLHDQRQIGKKIEQGFPLYNWFPSFCRQLLLLNIQFNLHANKTHYSINLFYLQLDKYINCCSGGSFYSSIFWWLQYSSASQDSLKKCQVWNIFNQNFLTAHFESRKLAATHQMQVAKLSNNFYFLDCFYAIVCLFGTNLKQTKSQWKCLLHWKDQKNWPRNY